MCVFSATCLECACSAVECHKVLTVLIHIRDAVPEPCSLRINHENAHLVALRIFCLHCRDIRPCTHCTAMFRKPKVDPVDQAKEWSRTLTREIRGMERQVKSIETEEAKIIKEIKKLSKEGSRNNSAVRVLAKQLVASRQAKSRMYEGRVQMHSVQMQLNNQISLVKVSNAISTSTEIMKAVGNLVKIPELQGTMMQLAREMEKAGLVDEVISDGMDMLDVSPAACIKPSFVASACCHACVHCIAFIWYTGQQHWLCCYNLSSYALLSL
jgi:Snf7